MASSDHVKKLREQLETITVFQDKSLVSRPEWGRITFEQAESDIDLVLSIARDLSDLPIENLTDNAAQHVTRAIPPVAQHLQQIDEFDITSGDASSNRDSITTGLHNAAESLVGHASPWIPYLAYQRGDVSSNIAQLNKAVKDAQKALGEAQDWIDSKKGEIEGIAKAAREAAGKAGVATFTEEFDTEATSLSKRSTRWLAATGVFALLTIAAAIKLYSWPELPDGAGAWETIRNTVSKLTIIAVLFTGTVWCGRIYRALMHQATINRHRALSLRTFQAFVKATDDPRVQDSVLMAATKTVFGTVPTGLVDHGRGDQEPNVQFVEIGRTAAERAAEAAD